MDEFEVNLIRKEHQIYVRGELVARPVTSFAHLVSKCVNAKLIEKLASMGVTEPTPVQMQALPCAL